MARFTVINGKTYMSIRDIIMVVSKKDALSATQTWGNLSEEHKEEVVSFLEDFQSPARASGCNP